MEARFEIGIQGVNRESVVVGGEDSGVVLDEAGVIPDPEEVVGAFHRFLVSRMRQRMVRMARRNMVSTERVWWKWRQRVMMRVRIRIVRMRWGRSLELFQVVKEPFPMMGDAVESFTRLNRVFRGFIGAVTV